MPRSNSLSLARTSTCGASIPAEARQASPAWPPRSTRRTRPPPRGAGRAKAAPTTPPPTTTTSGAVAMGAPTKLYGTFPVLDSAANWRHCRFGSHKKEGYHGPESGRIRRRRHRGAPGAEAPERAVRLRDQPGHDAALARLLGLHHLSGLAGVRPGACRSVAGAGAGEQGGRELGS